MEWVKGEYRVSDSKESLQVEKIFQWLQASYWAADRSRETIKQTIAHSHCFGLYKGDTQIGFARAVSDRVVFSWLMDVVIDESERGKGLGKWLLQCLLEHPSIRETRMGLATKDAHTLYEKFNFKKVETMRQSKS